MEYSLFELLVYFIIYSFGGWVLESIFRSICERKLINTGFLKGPFCPIYGLGAIIMLIVLNKFQENIFVLFVMSFIILTAWEYIVAIILEKSFNTKYWDYSNHRFNFQGRICLENSIYWGILGVVFIKVIQPFMKEIIAQIDDGILKFVVSIIMLVFTADVIISIINVKSIKSKLNKIENLNAQIKEKVEELKNATAEKDIGKSIIDTLKKKRNKTMLHLYKNVYRLKKAFPAINNKEIAEVLNKKIEIGKIKEKINKKIKK